jgi:hypothetical protein
MDKGNIAQQPYLTFFQDDTAEYDVIVDQSSSAPNLKEATWGAIQPLLPIVGPTMGPEEMALVLEYSPMPESFLEKFKALQEQKSQQPPPPDPEMMKLQADQQMKQQQLQFEQQKAAIDSQMKQQDMAASIQMEREKAMAQLQLEQEKAIQQFELEKMKLAQQMELERMKATMQMQIAREKADAEIALSARSSAFENNRADMRFEADVRRAEQMAKSKKGSA